MQMSPLPEHPKRFSLSVAILSVGLALFLVVALLYYPESVRGKAPARSFTQTVAPEGELAQDLALSDPQVQAWTVGRRSEVLRIIPADRYGVMSGQPCPEAACWQVEIYNFEEDTTIVAIVDVAREEVREVFVQPGVEPGLNPELADRAADVVRADPRVGAALGGSPVPQLGMPMSAGLLDSSCAADHLCAGYVFRTGERVLWAVVDLNEERLAGFAWTRTPAVMEQAQPFSGGGCPSPGLVEREGWKVSHDVTASDGLRVYDVSFRDRPVLTSAKLVEWHADYGQNGFVDSTGCGSPGGAFTIYPYGDTQVVDLENESGLVIGFEIVQDFRMPEWGNYCNYRYDQHFQFFYDGRFRVVGGAYGKSCGIDMTYRPVMRIDLAIDGDAGDSFWGRDGGTWVQRYEEGWWPQGTETSPEGFDWRIMDADGLGYFLEPGRGQFGDGGRGDDAYVYAVRHHPSEGDADLGNLGGCCEDDHQQGPHELLDGEPIDGENLVVWYVSQMEIDASLEDGNGYYCWTVSGEPEPETYPCFSGPMFVPVNLASFEHNAPVELGETVVFTNNSWGPEPRAYLWEFGDGTGVSTQEHPSYVYGQMGRYTVTLSMSNTLGVATARDLVQVGTAPGARFDHTQAVAPGETAAFTNTSTGTPPLSFWWNFGDGVTTTAPAPTHAYAVTGTYAVSLAAENLLGTDTYTHPIAVGVPATAAFTHDGPGLTGSPVTFTNLSIGGTGFLWEFGDGVGSSSETNPVYVYPEGGVYTITLTAANPFGSSATSLPVEILHAAFLPYLP